MSDPSLERIENALSIAAQHVVMNEAILPVFLRLEREYEAAKNIKSNPIARAKLIATEGVSTN